jgi:hypothetical protein
MERKRHSSPGGTNVSTPSFKLFILSTSAHKEGRITSSRKITREKTAAELLSLT